MSGEEEEGTTGGRGNNRRKKYVHVHEEMMRGRVMEKLRESNSRKCN